MGNLEANSRLALTYDSGLTGEVRLSRDTRISNSYEIEFERGKVTWLVGEGNKLSLKLNGLPFRMNSVLFENNLPAATYNQCFVNQLLNF